jgi:hypothetical protein
VGFLEWLRLLPQVCCERQKESNLQRDGDGVADEQSLDMSYLDTIVPESDSLLPSSYLDKKIQIETIAGDRERKSFR